MISNDNIVQITRIPFASEFLSKNEMKALTCTQNEDHSPIIYRTPIIIEVLDVLIENCQQITLSDLDHTLCLSDGSLLHISFALGLQDKEVIRQMSFEGMTEIAVFCRPSGEDAQSIFNAASH